MISKILIYKEARGLLTDCFRIPIFKRLNILKVLALILGVFSLIVVAQAHTYDCKKHHCGLISDGPYQHVILGTVTHIATANEEKTIYHWAKKHGYWKNLSGDEARFYKMIQIVSVKLPKDYGSKNVTLLMGQNFFKADIIRPGDFVRFTPHSYPRPRTTFKDPSDLPYWQLFGCIAILCQSVDKSCPARYIPGVYNRKTGQQITLLGDKLVKNGVRIDPVTYFPKK